MAKVTSKGILGLVVLLLKPILKAVSKPIEDELEKFLLKLYNKALATENPVDDLFMGLVLDMFDIPVPQQE